MISYPSNQELEELTTFHKPLCLSMYLPYVEPNASANTSRIELKNLLREAETELLSIGTSDHNIDKILKPIREHAIRSEIWPTRGEGLVFFSHPQFFRYFHINDRSIPRLVSAGTGFHLDPLLLAMQTNMRYFVLALGHKNVQLLEGDRSNIYPVQLKNFPRSMTESLRIDEYKQSSETHSIAASSSGKGSEAFHGQYNPRQTDKLMLKAFFRLIDKRLHSYLIKHPYPLLLGGVEYELAIYRSINTYKHTLADAITGNLDEVAMQDIHHKAWKIINKDLQSRSDR